MVKTRMMGLSDGEIILMTRSAVLTQITRVTDRRTDRQTELAWHIRATAYMLPRVKTPTTADHQVLCASACKVFPVRVIPP